MPAEELRDAALGETANEEGFRRVSRAPEPLALVRMRDLLLEAAADITPLSRQGLESFHSWRWLEALIGSGWASGTAAGSLAARRVLQRRLRILGTRPISIEEAEALPVGSAVHLRGTIRPVQHRLKPHMSHIWFQRAMTADNVRLLVEEGQHFFATDEYGRTARVIAANGYLINADALDAGDQVSVFGFTDRITDRRGLAGDLPTRDAQTLAVRAGDELPLLLRRHGSS
jgi:hypothetical protein